MNWKNINYPLISLSFVLVAGGVAGTGLAIEREIKGRREIKENSTIIQQAIALSAGEDKIWSIQEQRDFLNEMPLRDGVLVENTGMSLIPRANGVDVYTRIISNFGRNRFLPENYLGNIEYTTFKSYVTKKTAQLLPEVR